MKKLILFFVALLSISAVSAQQPNITNGQAGRVRLCSDVSSGAKFQTTPTAIIDANVTDSEGNILISRGTNVELNVSTVEHKGLGKPGEIRIDCLSTTAVDGQRIFLMGGMQSVGKEREGLAIGLGVGGGIVVFPFGFFCLCIKGEDAYIPSNTVLPNIVIDDNYTIKY
jgi:hypothetical protein